MTREEAKEFIAQSVKSDVDMALVADAIKALEQEPRKGHWAHGKELCREYLGKTLIDVTYEKWHCSNCQYVIEQVSKPKWNYCPNCGADMREVEE